MGFGMIVGGAMKGYAEGRKTELDEKRKIYLETLAQDRADRRDREGRDFQASQAELGRRFTAAEAAKARSASADLITADDGTTYVRDSEDGTKVKPLTDETGTRIKALTKGSNDPPIIDEANWLMKNGLAKDAKEAYRIAKQVKGDDPDKSRATIYKKWLEVLSSGNVGRVDSGKLIEEAKQRTEETLQYLQSADETDAAASEPPPAGGDSKAPERAGLAVDGKAWNGKEGFGRVSAPPKPDTSTPKPGGGNVNEVGLPAAPKNPADRKIGKVYYWPLNGNKGRWTEKGWVLVP